MLATLVRVLTSRAAGPTASATAVALGVLLALSWVGAARTEAQLRAQVARLSRQAQAEGRVWRAQLASCQGQAEALRAAAAPAPSLRRLTPVADGDATAERLATQGPAGFDVCARMEAADRAVLASLGAK